MRRVEATAHAEVDSGEEFRVYGKPIQNGPTSNSWRAASGEESVPVLVLSRRSADVQEHRIQLQTAPVHERVP